MLVIPLLFSALVIGVAEMGDLKSLGRAGWKTLAFTVVISGLAVLIGLVMVNLFRPGDGVDADLAAALLAQGEAGAASIVGNAPETINLGQFFLDLIPSNVFTAAAENQILPVMVFALLFGIGLVMARSPATDRLQEVVLGLFEITTVKASVFHPARPNDFRSPISATPMTSAENSSGMTSMNSSRRKICPIGPVT